MKKQSDIYSYTFGSHEINYSFLFPETVRRFENYIQRSDKDNAEVSVERSYFDTEKSKYSCLSSDDYIEFFSLLKLTANRLLHERCAVFHACAFLWKDKVWLITAPSGTGKTTQLLHWGRQFGKEIEAINGDKPVIECRNDGSVWVHSSPWTGKEKYGKPGMKGELGGIIMLEQGNKNQFFKLKAEDYVYPLFRSFFSIPETAEEIRLQAGILDQMVSHVKVWKLINKGDPESAKLTHDTLMEYMEKKDV